ncbi:MAG: iron-containing alcohol dehydrogenase, partial [Candidatus Woesearchaeota archaeon]
KELNIDEKNVLFVYGKGSIKKNNIYNEVKNNLKNHNVIELNNIKPNPDLNKVFEGIKLCKENNIEAVLAVGGGSVIDTSKAIAASYYVNDVWDLFEQKENIEKALPIYTILTISATGSEMNGNSVITNEKENKKWAIRNILLNPKITIIDPSIQKTLPKIQTANGAMDTLSHIMEFYFTFETEETMIALNESLMKSTIKATDILLNNPEDYHARENLCWCATLALNGISGTMGNGGEWQCHLIEHGLSAFKKDLDHGKGLSIIFPAWINYVHNNKPIFKRWAKEIWNKDNVEDALIEMKNKFKSWGLPISLNEVNIYEKDIDEIVDIIIKSPPRNSFIKELNKDDYKKILISCLKV